MGDAHATLQDSIVPARSEIDYSSGKASKWAGGGIHETLEMFITCKRGLQIPFCAYIDHEFCLDTEVCSVLRISPKLCGRVPPASIGILGI
jgi:hypothetical protein